MKYASPIKKKRLEKGLTQKQLAKLLGIPRSTIASYEIGVSKPKGKKALEISQLLEIPIEELIV